MIKTAADGSNGETLRLVIVSDLHYRVGGGGTGPLPAAAGGEETRDPIGAFIEYAGKGPSAADWKADYLLCPGDIPDQSSGEAFVRGWEKLKDLQEALSARHLIAATGNHEVVSRSNDSRHDQAGNVEATLDPLGYLQQRDDYPSSLWNGVDRKWVYWGRGYEFIEDGDMLLLLINSSHFHVTTRPNEYERGRISDTALDELRRDIQNKVATTPARGFLALMHHHPVNHEDLDVNLGRIDMMNGSRLLQVLSESGVGWLIIHGHKHHGRLILSQGDGCQSVVLAAGSAGAQLSGGHGIRTRLQAYMVEIDLPCQRGAPSLRGSLSAVSWIDNSWVSATDLKHGIPNGCGFSMPMIDVANVAHQIRKALQDFSDSYCSWSEIKEVVPDLRYLFPGQLKHLRNELVRIGVKVTWPEDRYFPEQLAP